MRKDIPKKGILAALWTPTDSNGNLSREALSENLKYLKSCSIHGILALGSTGEFPYFNVQQRKEVLSAIAELADPLPVIGNVSDISPRVVAELAKHSADIGLSGVAIMAPGFYPGSQEQLLAHFLNAANASGLPCMLYNFPELAGTRIELETVIGFSERAPLAAVKQSGSQFEYHHDLIRLGQERGFSVFSGADTRLPEAFSIGAAGCIGGLVNIYPEAMLHLYRVCHDHEAGEIEPEFSRLKELGSIIDRIPFPINVAAGMESRGFAIGNPKSLVSAETKMQYQEIVDTLRAKFESWGVPVSK